SFSNHLIALNCLNSQSKSDPCQKIFSNELFRTQKSTDSSFNPVKFMMGFQLFMITDKMAPNLKITSNNIGGKPWFSSMKISSGLILRFLCIPQPGKLPVT